jgi:hypothetical protein
MFTISAIFKGQIFCIYVGDICNFQEEVWFSAKFFQSL